MKFFNKSDDDDNSSSSSLFSFAPLRSCLSFDDSSSISLASSANYIKSSPKEERLSSKFAYRDSWKSKSRSFLTSSNKKPLRSITFTKSDIKCSEKSKK
mmetsp:Transcript_29127/g.44460  ORF Transcript_29127/g.44460 Transcript_29127/m.44460 type:complete len:99 (+) Transcript_29127:285-581(+)